MKKFLFNKQALPTGALFIILAASLWAVDGVLRRNLYTLSPLVIVFFEHVIGSLLIMPFFISVAKKEHFSTTTLFSAASVALLSGLFGTLWFTTALLKVNYISFSVVFLLQKLQPIFAASSAKIILKEKITHYYLLWAGLAFVAAYFVTFPTGTVNLATGSGTAVAALFALGAAAAWGTSTTLSKVLLSQHSPIFSTGLRFLLTTCFAFVALVMTSNIPQVFSITLQQIIYFTLIALSTGLVALYFYYKGLKTTQAKVATILELVFPVLAISIDAFLYKTFLSPIQIIATLVLLFSVYKTAQADTQKLSS